MSNFLKDYRQEGGFLLALKNLKSLL